MEYTLKAILARNKFDKHASMDYCSAIARQYSHLETEYWGLFDALKAMEN